jgi:hypothetical protein
MGHGRGTGIDEMGKKNTTKGEIYYLKRRNLFLILSTSQYVGFFSSSSLHRFFYWFPLVLFRPSIVFCPTPRPDLNPRSPCSIVHPSRRSESCPLQRRHSRLSSNEDLHLELRPKSVHRPSHHPISTVSQIPRSGVLAKSGARVGL